MIIVSMGKIIASNLELTTLSSHSIKQCHSASIEVHYQRSETSGRRDG